MFILSLFQQAWKVLWRHPSLWVYGMFLAILGQGGMSEVVLRAVSTLSSVPRGAAFSDLLLERDFWWIGGFGTAQVPMLLLKGVGILIVFAGIVISMAAIPLAVRSILERRRVQRVPELFHEALQYAGRVAGLFLISSVAFMLLLLPAVLMLRAVNDPTPAALFGERALVALLAACSGAVFFVSLYATNAIVLRSASLVDGIREGWSVFAKHWAVSIECALAFFVINILAAQITDALIRPILALSYLATLFLVGRGYPTLAYASFIAVGVVFVTVVWVLLVSLYAAFQTIVWTALYLQLRNRSAQAKGSVHLFSAFKAESRASGI